ncbi:MAG: hypothetical protein Tsb0032_21610 [Kiloniellaceae bacterium]
MKTSEIILLASLAIFAGVLLWFSLDIPYSAGQGFGPGYLPLNLAVATLALIAVLAVKALAARRGGAAMPGAQEAPSGTAAAVLPVVATVALLALATLAMALGSVLAPLGIVMVLISWRLSGHGLLRSILVNAAVLGAIYVIFGLWLRIPLQ